MGLFGCDGKKDGMRFADGVEEEVRCDLVRGCR